MVVSPDIIEIQSLRQNADYEILYIVTFIKNYFICAYFVLFIVNFIKNIWKNVN